MNTCTKCNYLVAVGTQADINSYAGPCADGHHFAVHNPVQPGNYLHPVNFIEQFPSHILHIYTLFAFDEFNLMR